MELNIGKNFDAGLVNHSIMKSRYSISIPKPCHENWNTMTPAEKGRFCQSCSKTVVDFTNMKTDEVQAYVHQNKHQRICGHIRKSQLDTINLQISETVFEHTMSFHKLFLLALLLTMGTSLFSCADDSGQKKKIESIEIIEKVIDSTQSGMEKQMDSTVMCAKKDKVLKTQSNKESSSEATTDVVLDGIMIMGEIFEQPQSVIHPDSINEPQYPEIEGEMVFQEEAVFGMLNIESPPEFKDTPKHLYGKEKTNYLKKSISEFVAKNFNTNYGDMNLNGKQRIYAKFVIDKNGNVKDVKVKAPNEWFENETIRVIGLLPQFIPAMHNNRPVEMPYSIPIIFNIED